MAGSGLLELWSIIYAKSSVERIQTGHAYARALRAHSLTQLALTTILLDEVPDVGESLKDICELYRNILQNDELILNIENSETLCHVQERLTQLTSDLKKRSETSKLWLQYYEQVELIRMFIRAERMGDWDLHLHSVRQMLPFFHAAAHLPYAKAAQLYLQQMEKLENLLPPSEFQNFVKNGFFTVRRSDRYWSGIWTDMTIEQVLMRSMKVTGGLTQGRGLTDSTLATWIQAMPACLEITEAVEEFSGVTPTSTSEQHVELRDSRQFRDKNDTNKLVDWLKDHNPFKRESKNLVSLFSGMVADDTINCQNAKEIGMQSMSSMVGINFADLKLKRNNKVKTLASMVNGVKIRDEIVIVNTQQLFNRIACVIDSTEDLKNYMKYELAPRSPSLFDDISMRKGNKASLGKILIDVVSNDSHESNTETLYVIDGGHLMHKVVWPKPATYMDLLHLYESYLISHYGPKILVVFDGYDSSNSLKVEEQMRRASKNISVDVEVKEKAYVSISQAAFLNNSHNKSQLIKLLREKLSKNGIQSCQAQEDADRLIVVTAINEAQINNIPVTVVAEDTDVLVLLISHTDTNSGIHFLKPGLRNTSTTVIKICNLQNRLGNLKEHLLFVHAMTGCDTTSALYGKGKKTALKLLEINEELRNAVSIFTMYGQSHSNIARAGEWFLVSFYGGQASDTINECRYYTYNRLLARLAVKSSFELAKLPPTSAAAQQHSYRVYLQVLKWKGIDLNPEEWGWQRGSNGTLIPIVTTLSPAPDNLLKLISCGCKKSCKTNCECKKGGLVCTAMCAYCRGNSCDNAGSVSYDDEDN